MDSLFEGYGANEERWGKAQAKRGRYADEDEEIEQQQEENFHPNRRKIRKPTRPILSSDSPIISRWLNTPPQGLQDNFGGHEVDNLDGNPDPVLNNEGEDNVNPPPPPMIDQEPEGDPNLNPDNGQLAAAQNGPHLLAMINRPQHQNEFISAALLLRQAGCQFFHTPRDALNNGRFLPRTPPLQSEHTGVFMLPQSRVSGFGRMELDGYVHSFGLQQRISYQAKGICRGSKRFDFLVKEPGDNGAVCLYDVMRFSGDDFDIPNRQNLNGPVTQAQKLAGYRFSLAKVRQEKARDCLVGLPEVEYRIIFDVSEFNVKSRKQILLKIINAVVKLKLREAEGGMPKFQLLCRTHENKLVLTEVYDFNNDAVFAWLSNNLWQYFHQRHGNMMNFELRYETLLDLMSIYPCIKPNANLYFVHDLTSIVGGWCQQLLTEITQVLSANTDDAGRALLAQGQELTGVDIQAYFYHGSISHMGNLYNQVLTFEQVLRQDYQTLSRWVRADVHTNQTKDRIDYLYRVLRQYQGNQVQEGLVLEEGHAVSEQQFQQCFSQAPWLQMAQEYNQALQSHNALEIKMTQLRQLWLGELVQDPVDQNVGGMQLVN